MKSLNSFTPFPTAYLLLISMNLHALMNKTTNYKIIKEILKKEKLKSSQK